MKITLNEEEIKKSLIDYITKTFDVVEPDTDCCFFDVKGRSLCGDDIYDIDNIEFVLDGAIKEPDA